MTTTELTPDQQIIVDAAKAAAVVEAKNEALGLLRSYVRRASVGFLLLLVGIGYAINGNTQALNDSHERGQKVRTVICTILTQSDEQTYASAKKFNLSASELQASLKTTAHYREEVGPAPGCDNTITPPPGIPIN